MIIVKLMGGLGNQMFQYAAARHLSIIHKVPVKIDISFLQTDPKGAYSKRNFELNCFNIMGDFANEKETKSYLKIKQSRISRNLNERFPFLFNKFHGKEKGHGYDECFIKFPVNTYLDGFWQSEKYFKPIENILRREFTFKTPLSGINFQIAQNINECESIGIHIRRTDYIINSQVLNFHGICDLNYYQEAINIISQKTSHPHLFVFSDDPEWVKTNFKTNLPLVCVDHNSISDKGSEDMRLMSLCKHQIIANSSFSWWAAWLNINQNKIVVAPSKWFNEPSVDSKDIIPKEWIKI